MNKLLLINGLLNTQDDWTDETILASYESCWLGELLNARHEVAHTTSDHGIICNKCGALILK